MADFETHERGTAKELALCRELVKEIEQVTALYGNGIVPHGVFLAYEKMKTFYEKKVNEQTV